MTSLSQILFGRQVSNKISALPQLRSCRLFCEFLSTKQAVPTIQFDMFAKPHSLDGNAVDVCRMYQCPAILAKSRNK